MKKLLFILITNCILFDSFSQIQRVAPSPFFSFNNANLSIGGINGVGPNLRNEFPGFYYFIEGNTDLSIKNIPFKLSFKNSNELLRYGKANYFRFSYDPTAYRRENLKSYFAVTQQYLNEQGNQKKMIAELESKLGFIYQKKVEYELKANNYKFNELSLDTINTPAVPNLPNIKLDSLAGLDNKSVQLPTINTPTFKNPYQVKLDSLTALQDMYFSNLNEANLKLKEINGKYDTSLIDYKSYQNRLGTFDFLSNVNKLDFGLTTMKKSSFSNNALPFEGVSFGYDTEKYFVDVAAGFTLPNQIVTNKVFDQLVYNTANVLNASSFFQINSTRFVSNVTTGYGKLLGNHVAIENYYGGQINSFTNVSNSNSTGRTLTSNLSTNLVIKPIKGLSWKNTMGLTWLNDDSLSQTYRIEEKIGLSSILNYQLSSSAFQVLYRYLSKGYDGWIQGVFIQNTERLEFNYRQNIGARVRTVFKVAKSRYGSLKSLGERNTNEGALDVNLKLNKNLVVSSNYTLLQLSERKLANAISSNYSHIGRLIITNTITKKRYALINNHELGIASIATSDTNQQIAQLLTAYRFQFKKLGVGVQFNYNHYLGLHQLFGHSLTIQPEISYRTNRFYISAAANYLISQQFGNLMGARMVVGFVFDRFIDVNIQFQRYLPTDFVFYFETVDLYRKPNYLKFAVNIHLFSPHKKRS